MGATTTVSPLGGIFGGAPPAPASSAPPATATSAKFLYPPEAFMTPPAIGGNNAYWNGYALGKANVGLLPSPKGMSDFWAYAAACAVFEKPRATNGFTGMPIDGNDGYDDALRDGRNYRWQHDPQSPDIVGQP